MIGQSLGAYQVLSKLGEGGMGEVYRARDTKLDREVALKILPADMVADVARLERFSREARALAALNHPHIVTIHSTEEAGGIRFLTMELVEGKSLDRVVPESGLPFAQLLDIAVPLCDAIAAAHDKHLTHRDLKPANVMVSDAGRVKVLDFGLASFGKAVAQQPDVTRMELTHQGTVLGTAPYMSPEQVEGKVLDHRTDIFSLGIMLYEMASGTRPFQGDSSPALMSSILKDTPVSLRDIRADLPSEFVRLVARCLEKDPRERVQTARDVFNELKSLRREFSSATGSQSRSAQPLLTPRNRYPLVAVTPFDARGAGDDAQVLANGLGEDITAALLRFSYVRVGARSDARYVMEGTVRKAGAMLRIMVRLVDAATGVPLWAETFNRPSDADAFAIQDQLTARVVATVADSAGVLVRSMAAALTDRPYEQLSAAELVLRYFVYLERFRPDEHARLRDAFEAVTIREPDSGEAWAVLARLYEHEFAHGLNPRPDAQVRARRAAERSIDLNPIGQAAWEAVASTHFFARDLGALRMAADRVITLNPLNASAIGFMAMMLSWAGDWDRGLELLGRAMEYNPNHAGWYHFVGATNFYRLGRFEESLTEAKRVNMAQLPWTHTTIAMAAGQLGRRSDARIALDSLRRVNPQLLDLAVVREAFTHWFFDASFIESMIDGLSKALSLAGTESPRSVESSAVVAPPSTISTVDRRISTAVASFTVQGSDADVRSIAEGLVEDIGIGLARFSYLSLAADPSAARFVVGGSVRKAGSAFRVAAHLLDRSTGTHLWAETYNRTNADDLFSLQDDLTNRIVATVADPSGVLVRAMAATLTGRPYGELTATELVLRYHVFLEQFRPEEHEQLRDALEQAVVREPGHADAWAALSRLYEHERTHNLNPRPNAMERFRQAAERSTEVNPMCQAGWEALASYYFFSRDRDGLRDAVNRVLTLNPRNTGATAFMGMVLAWSGEWDRGVALMDRAIDWSPHHPGWYHFITAHKLLRVQRYEEALAETKRVNMPHLPWWHLDMAVSAGYLGRRGDAQAAIDALKRVNPNLLNPDHAGAAWSMWLWEEEQVAVRVEGLRKAIALVASTPAASASGSRPPSSAENRRERMATAVAAFTVQSSDADTQALAGGLREEIASGLARFAYLSVVDDIGASRYVLGGSIRRVGNTLRVSAHLLDRTLSSHLWAETYQRSLADKDLFELQDDLRTRIVSTVADASGVLVRSMAAAVGERSLDELSAFELVLRYHTYADQVRPTEHARLREAFERLVEREPSNADAWARLAAHYWEEYAHGLNPRPDPLSRARDAAQRAIEINPLCEFAWRILGGVHFFTRDAGAMRVACERAIQLNPLNGETVALVAMFLGWSGDMERGVRLMRAAIDANPHHPGWYHYLTSSDCFSRGLYEEALTEAKRVNMPHMAWTHYFILVPAATLDRRADVQTAVEALRKIDPQLLDVERARVAWARWLWDEQQVEKNVEGLRKALALVGSGVSQSRVASTPSTIGALNATKFATAVLRFSAPPGDQVAQDIGDALTDEVTRGLARFFYLSVVTDAAGARYHIGGTIRRAGTGLRIGAQLVDTATGAHLWAETYARSLGDDALTVVDEVTDKIVATVADVCGALVRAMVQTIRHVPLDELSGSELLLRHWGFQHRPTPEEHAALRAETEKRLAESPAQRGLWAALSHCYQAEYALFFNELPDPLGRATRAARREIDLDRSNELGWEVLALASFYGRDRNTFFAAAEQALSLNPRNANTTAWMGNLLTHAGEYDNGVNTTARAKALNPQHPGWYHFAAFTRHFKRGEFEEALNAARRANMPDFFWQHFAVAAAAGQLHRQGEARTAHDAMVELAPPMAEPAMMREFVTRWYWDEDLIESILAGIAAGRGAPIRKPPSGIKIAAENNLATVITAFTVQGTEADSRAIADGLTEEVTSGLAKFDHLVVVSSAAPARYQVGGTIRQLGSALRISAHLIDTESGARLWNDTYTRDLQTLDAFAIVDDVTDRIVGTVGDVHGALLRSMTHTVRDRPLDELTARELAWVFWAYDRQHSPEMHIQLRSAVERAVKRWPNDAMLSAVLATLYAHAFAFDFAPSSDAMARSLQAARRAIDLEPTSQPAWQSIALAYFFGNDRGAFLDAVERAVALNPRNANTMAWLGTLVGHSGEDERGAAMTKRAMTINPHHPGWYYFAEFALYYYRAQYAEALAVSKKVNMPDHHWWWVSMAVCHVHLGEMPEAIAAVRKLAEVAPGLEQPGALRKLALRWHHWRADRLDGLCDTFDRAARAAAGAVDATPPSTVQARGEVARSTVVPEGGLFVVAVLPFASRSGDPDCQSLAEGLTDDITVGLSRFPWLVVIPRGAVRRPTDASADTCCRIGAQLGAQYVIDGSVRKAGNVLRVSAQLIDVAAHGQLWAENFDRDLGKGMFAVQDELSSRIVATAADSSGILMRTIADAVAHKPLTELTTWELHCRVQNYADQFRPEQHAAFRAAFEQVVERDSLNPAAWGMLAVLYAHEVALQLNPLPDVAARVRRAAERAMDLGPTTQVAWIAAMWCAYVEHDLEALIAASERAVAINPLNTRSVAAAAHLAMCVGQFERAERYLASAMTLNPNHPSWYRLVDATLRYQRGDYEGALHQAKAVNMPAFVPVHLLAVAAAGQLGRPSETRITLDTFTRAFPTLRTAERARAEWGAIFWDGPLVDHLVAGVEQALALSGALTPSITSSTTAAVADRFAIGVRPLRPAGGNAAETLADGLTDAIVTRISRFSYLRVARSRATDSDIRKSGYFLDGNVRVVGRNVRVTVDLTAADTQTSVWSQAYDRQIGDEGFALQDALGDTIVATIADANGALVRSIAAAVQAKPIADLTPYEAVLRRFVYINQLSEEEHAVVRECLEAAVEQAPAYADAWACLAYVYSHEESTSFNTRPNALDRALAAAQRALQLEAANPLGYQSLAIVQYFRRDLAAFRAAAERAMALNPLDCYTLCIHGVFTAYAGDWEQGLALAARARALNPDHPGIYWAPDCVDRFRRRDYAGALELVERINTPRYPPYVILKAAVYGQLGRVDEARAVWEQGVGGSPAARWIDIFDKWFSPELASHAREGLLKAGIEA